MPNQQSFNPDNENDGSVVLESKKKEKLKTPSMYRVVLINDDYTPMEFVVWLIQQLFHKTLEESTRLMMDVHTKGKGICGVFTFEVAQSKALQVKNLAKKHQHPLECLVEPEQSHED